MEIFTIINVAVQKLGYTQITFIPKCMQHETVHIDIDLLRNKHRICRKATHESYSGRNDCRTEVCRESE